MPTQNIQVVPSYSMNRALATNSQSQAFTTFGLQTQPVAIQATQPADTVWPAGAGGMFAPQRLKVMFFASGGAGNAFSARLYAWFHHGDNPDTLVWIPVLLAEFALVTGALPGPAALTNFAPYVIKPDEYMCDGITLVQGSVGATGEIVTIGPGTGFVSLVMCELRGAKFFQFDFQQSDSVLMNALWSSA